MKNIPKMYWKYRKIVCIIITISKWNKPVTSYCDYISNSYCYSLYIFLRENTTIWIKREREREKNAHLIVLNDTKSTHKPEEEKKQLRSSLVENSTS